MRVDRSLADRYSERGIALLDSHQPAAASEQLCRALAIVPWDERTASLLVMALCESRRSQEGRSLADSWMARHGNAPEVVAALGMACAYLHDLDAAVSNLLRAVQVVPETVSFLDRTLWGLLAHGRNGEVRELCETWLVRDPARPYALRYLGLACEAEGDLVAAQRAFRLGVRVAPGNEPMAIGLVRVLRRLGRAAEAVSLGERAREHLDESSPELINHLACAYFDERELEAALALVEAASRGDPANPLYAGNRMAALCALGRAAEARGMGRAWLDAHPPHQYVLLHLGHACLESGSPAEAEDRYRHAVGFGPDDRVARLGLRRARQAAMLEATGHRATVDKRDESMTIRRYREWDSGIWVIGTATER